MTSSASFTDRTLYLLHAARMVALSLERGNAEGSVFWYGCYGFILAGHGRAPRGPALRPRRLRPAGETRASPRRRGQSHFFLALTSFWTEPLAEARAQTAAGLAGLVGAAVP